MLRQIERFAVFASRQLLRQLRAVRELKAHRQQGQSELHLFERGVGDAVNAVTVALLAVAVGGFADVGLLDIWLEVWEAQCSQRCGKACTRAIGSMCLDS